MRVTIWPLLWNIGKIVMVRVWGPNWSRSDSAFASASMLMWVSTTPFGFPVVPEV